MGLMDMTEKMNQCPFPSQLPPPPNADVEMTAATADNHEVDDAQNADMSEAMAAATADKEEGGTHNADISEAIMLSKAEGPVPISSDGQVILQIVRMSNTQQTLDALF